MNYAEISKETVSFLYKSYGSLKNSPLEASIRVLVELRASQINGCEYCCKLHKDEARSLGIAQEKIDHLSIWKDSNDFSEKEKIAFQWAEEITSLKETNESKEQLKMHFSER